MNKSELFKYQINNNFYTFLAKQPAVPLRLAYGNVTEFTTLAELDNISTDVDAMRIQSLLICERVLGIQHTDTLFRFMFRYINKKKTFSFICETGGH